MSWSELNVLCKPSKSSDNMQNMILRYEIYVVPSAWSFYCEQEKFIAQRNFQDNILVPIESLNIFLLYSYYI